MIGINTGFTRSQSPSGLVERPAIDPFIATAQNAFDDSFLHRIYRASERFWQNKLADDSDYISAEEANKLYGTEGLIQFDKPITHVEAATRRERAIYKGNLEAMAARSMAANRGFIGGAKALVGSFAGMLDPIDLLLTAVPVVGQEAKAVKVVEGLSAFAKARNAFSAFMSGGIIKETAIEGIVGNRFLAKAAEGAIEGTVGGLIYEPFNIATKLADNQEVSIKSEIGGIAAMGVLGTTFKSLGYALSRSSTAARQNALKSTVNSIIAGEDIGKAGIIHATEPSFIRAVGEERGLKLSDQDVTTIQKDLLAAYSEGELSRSGENLRQDPSTYKWANEQKYIDQLESAAKRFDELVNADLANGIAERPARRAALLTVLKELENNYGEWDRIPKELAEKFFGQTGDVKTFLSGGSKVATGLLREDHARTLQALSVEDVLSRARASEGGPDKFIQGLLGGNETYKLSLDLRVRTEVMRRLSFLQENLSKSGLIDFYHNPENTEKILTEKMRLLGVETTAPVSAEGQQIARLLINSEKRLTDDLNNAGIYFTEDPLFDALQTTSRERMVSNATNLKRAAIKNWKSTIKEAERELAAEQALASPNKGRILSLQKKLKNAASSLSAAERKTLMDTHYEQWFKDTAPLIDMEDFFLGAKIEDKQKRMAEFQRIMKLMHDGLFSGQHGSIIEITRNNPIFKPKSGGGLRESLNRQRFIKLKKDGAAWTAYNKAYGHLSLSGAVQSTVESQSKILHLARTFGPDFENGFSAVMDTLKKEFAGDEKILKGLNSSWTSRMWDDLVGRVSTHEKGWFNKLVDYANNINVMSLMGKVFLSAQIDRANMYREARYNGVARMDAIMQNLASYVSKYKGRSQQVMDTLRAVGASQHFKVAYIAGRFAEKDLDGNRFTRGYMEATLLPFHDRANKEAMVGMLVANLGNRAEQAFSDLPDTLQHILKQYDIGAKDWDIARKHVWYLDEASEGLLDPGTRFITPDKIGDKVVAEKFHNYLIDRANTGVLTPGLRERTYASLGADPNTPLGALVKAVMLFKTFPITVWTKQISRDLSIHGARSFGFNKATMLGSLEVIKTAAYLTVAGVFVNGIRDILNGRTPEKMVDEEGNLKLGTFVNALVRSGGLGPIGDIFLTKYDRRYSNPIQSLTGATMGDFGEIMSITSEISRGEAPPRQAIYKTILSNIPAINLFYLRPALDKVFLQSLQEAVNPGYYEDLERAIKRETGQEFFGPFSPKDRFKNIEEL